MCLSSVCHPSTDNVAIKSTGKSTCLIENSSHGEQISLFLSLWERNRWLNTSWRKPRAAFYQNLGPISIAWLLLWSFYTAMKRKSSDESLSAAGCLFCLFQAACLFCVSFSIFLLAFSIWIGTGPQKVPRWDWIECNGWRKVRAVFYQKLGPISIAWLTAQCTPMWRNSYDESLSAKGLFWVSFFIYLLFSVKVRLSISISRQMWRKACNLSLSVCGSLCPCEY